MRCEEEQGKEGTTHSFMRSISLLFVGDAILGLRICTVLLSPKCY